MTCNTDALLPSGLPGVDAHAPKLSFSAALTVPMETSGTIVFDKVFVNQGNLYDPKTGKSSNLSLTLIETRDMSP